ncbi:hypothetical protein NADFUDRAFT_81843 [Nadsonia fulvescens var. elongata DSM 6958]|uniref:Tyrosine--tRNA ligase n=1 Tax=Nadsonia fulvescens var. elongata DSM 6958 TaxID=857566 RepID=A0A1E3PQ19_9ASCO|nr:hypothetical protein NADFUDRAFT_81843 [Nadsonia fulvescens var. elongata DSM 6958]
MRFPTRNTTRTRLIPRLVVSGLKKYQNIQCRALSSSFIEASASNTSTAPPTTSNISLIEHLEKRGLISTLSSPKFCQLVQSKKIAVYCGTDPTGGSLHIGHLLPLMTLLHFYLDGHTAVGLIGGATGIVGDPSGRKTERDRMEQDIREQNIKSLGQQVQRFIENGSRYASKYKQVYTTANHGKLIMKNNREWWENVRMLEFLGTYGPHIRVSQMIARDSIKDRLDSQAGIGFNEFTYQILQAYDFWHLYCNEGVAAQIGGNDQWGNITAGIDLISRLRNKKQQKDEAFGMTVPLLTDRSGNKIGKSTGSSVWLDPTRTTPYHFYQFFMNLHDDEIEKYFKLFTLVPLKQISIIMAEHDMDTSKRIGQRVLASEIIEMIHGDDARHGASVISDIFFNKDLAVTEKYTTDELINIFRNGGVLKQMERKDLKNYSTVKLAASIFNVSRSAAKAVIKEKGVSFGFEAVKVNGLDDFVRRSYIIDDKLIVMRYGKNQFATIEITNKSNQLETIIFDE